MCFHVTPDNGGRPKHVASLINKYVLSTLICCYLLQYMAYYINMVYHVIRVRDSVVGTADRYGLEDPGIESQ